MLGAIVDASDQAFRIVGQVALLFSLFIVPIFLRAKSRGQRFVDPEEDGASLAVLHGIYLLMFLGALIEFA